MNNFPVPSLEAIADLAEHVLLDTILSPLPVAIDTSLRVEKTSPDTLTAELRLSGKLDKD